MEIPTKYEKPKAARFIALFFGLGLGALILGIAVWFLPIEWNEAKNRFRLWRAGAEPVLWERHRGFTLDRCGGKTPEECPCVWLLHGMGDSVSTWRRFFLDEASFGNHPVRIYAVDLPGHGGSLRRKDLTEYRVSTIAREFDEKITAEIKCKRNVLVGNSFGGWVATLMVLQNSKLFSHLVLIAPVGVGLSTEANSIFTNPTIETLKDFQKRAYYMPRELPEKVWQVALERIKNGSVPEIRDAQIPEDRLTEKLSGLTTPTLLLHGDADRIIARTDMDLFLKKQPAIKFKTLSECGHLPQKECPEQLYPMLSEIIAN